MKTCDYSYYDFNATKLNKTCSDLMDQLNDLMTNVQPYDLFGKCYYHKESSKLSLYSPNKNIFELTDEERKELRKRVITVVDYASFKYRNRPDYHKLRDDIPCGTYDTVLLDYFNSDSVKKALHIDASVTDFQLCSNIEYTMLPEGTFDIYQTLTADGNVKYKILKYSGDADGVVPTYGTQ